MDVPKPSRKVPKRPWSYYITINRKLVPLKIFMFFYYGGFVALYPYLTIHMKSIGITVAQTGILYAIAPICSLGGPLAGIIADKSGQYKLSLMAFILISISLHIALYFVPAYSIKTITEEIPVTTFDTNIWCNDNGSASDVIFQLPESHSSYSCKPPYFSEDQQLLLQHCLPRNCPNAPVICQNNLSGINKCWSYPDSDLTEVFIPTPILSNNESSNSESGNIVWKVQKGLSCVAQNIERKDHCHTACKIMPKSNLTLSCVRQQSHGHQLTTFLIYSCVRLAGGFTISLAFTLVDASLIQMVADFDGDIGINRAFGSVGFCLVPPLSGLLIDYVSRLNGDGEVDYRPAFLIFTIGMGLSIVVLIFSQVQARVPTQNIWKNAVKLLKYKRIVAFLVIFFFIGTAWGLLESFLFLFLDEDLHVEKWLLGFTNTVGGLTGIPFAACMTWIVSKTGYTKLFIFGLFMFGLRFIGYSFIYNPYLILPLEALEAITCTLPLIGASMYAAGFSAELLATLQGVNSAVHFGFGRGFGSLIGGFLISSFGTRKSFQIFGGICVFYSIVHAILHYTYLRNLPKIEPKEKPTAENGKLLESEEKKEAEKWDTEDYPAQGEQFNAIPLLNPLDPETVGSFIDIDQIGRSAGSQGVHEDDIGLRQRR